MRLPANFLIAFLESAGGMMITIEMTSWCAGCLNAELELESAEDMLGRKLWAVKCQHAAACEAMRGKAIDETLEAIERKTGDDLK